MSVPQIDTARTRHRTSFRPGAGTGTCWISNRFGSSTTRASIVDGMAAAGARAGLVADIVGLLDDGDGIDHRSGRAPDLHRQGDEQELVDTRTSQGFEVKAFHEIDAV